MLLDCTAPILFLRNGTGLMADSAGLLKRYKNSLIPLKKPGGECCYLRNIS